MTVKEKKAVKELVKRFKDSILANPKYKLLLNDKTRIEKIFKDSILKKRPDLLEYALTLL